MSEQLLRLFFALPCPDGLAASIADWRSTLAVDGKPVKTSNLHVTLAFLGMQPHARLPQLLQLAESIETPAFMLDLDQLNLWPNGLLHLAPSQPPEALLMLAGQLRDKLSSIGIQLDQRNYLPHLTLARHAQLPKVLQLPAFAWKVCEFSLFISENQHQGVHYRPLATWQLR